MEGEGEEGSEVVTAGAEIKERSCVSDGRGTTGQLDVSF
jgi:hypothetical protein